MEKNRASVLYYPGRSFDVKTILVQAIACQKKRIFDNQQVRKKFMILKIAQIPLKKVMVCPLNALCGSSRKKSRLSLSSLYLSYSRDFVPLVDDPWMAAHQFLERNDLSQMFLDQVVDFIQKNTQGVTIGQQAPSAADPFYW